jgi:hypothetical protein
MRSSYKRLGDYIQLLDERNRGNAIGEDRFLGIFNKHLTLIINCKFCPRAKVEE